MLNHDPEKANGESHPIRCLCGRLLARRVPGAVEIKCRRCRRIVLIIAIDANDEVLKVDEGDRG